LEADKEVTSYNLWLPLNDLVIYSALMAQSEIQSPADPGRSLSVRPVQQQRLRLIILGGFELWVPGGGRVEVKSRRARAILAILGWSLDKVVTRRFLGGLLWSRSGEAQQRDSLRHALTDLQAALQVTGEGWPLIRAIKDGIYLSSDDVWVDALDVRAGRFRCADDLDILRHALFSDLEGIDSTFSGWIEQQRDGVRAAAIPFARSCLEQATDPAARAAAAQRWLYVDPTAEIAWQELIKAEASRGERAAALAAIDRYRHTLKALVGASIPPDIAELANVLRHGSSVGEAIAPAAAAQQRIRRGARLGVLPLRITGAGLSDDLALSLAEEVSVALARFRWICVVDSLSLSTAARANGEQASVRQHQLNFVLSGTAQAQDERLRLSIRLIDLGDNDAIVWSERFDREFDDLFTLQDEIASAIVARVDPELLRVEAGRIGRRPPREPSAYDLLLRAIPGLHRLQRAEFFDAGKLLKEAAAADPDYATAHAWLAYWYILLVGQGWDGDEGVIPEAERTAARAVELDPVDALGLTVLGHVRAYLYHRVDDGIMLHQRALACNPNLAMAWAFSGMSSSYVGDHATSLEQFGRYSMLAPTHPHDFFFRAGLMLPLLQLGRYDEVIQHSRQIILVQPNLTFALKVLLAALGHTNAKAAADVVRGQLLRLEPDFDLLKAQRRSPFHRSEDADHYLDGLQLGGLS
jgi:TolB-like protein